MRHLFILILFLLTGCSINMGNIPIIVKEDEGRVIDYGKLEQQRSLAKNQAAEAKECLHIFLFIPTKLDLNLNEVMSKSCSNSNYTFNNQIKDNFFYLLYGRECLVNENSCAKP